MNINQNNIEEYLYRYCEGLLSAEEQVSVDSWLATHPEWEKEISLYDKSLRLSPDQRLVFSDKQMLRSDAMEHRVVSQRKGLIIPLWLRYSSVACLSLVLLFGLLHRKNNPVDETVALPVSSVATFENEESMPSCDGSNVENSLPFRNPISSIEEHKSVEQRYATSEILDTHISFPENPTEIEPVLSSTQPDVNIVAIETLPSPAVETTQQLIQYDEVTPSRKKVNMNEGIGVRRRLMAHVEDEINASLSKSSDDK